MWSILRPRSAGAHIALHLSGSKLYARPDSLHSRHRSHPLRSGSHENHLFEEKLASEWPGDDGYRSLRRGNNLSNRNIIFSDSLNAYYFVEFLEES